MKIKEVEIERVKAVEKKRLNRRIKQFFMLAFLSLPLLLYLGYLFEKIKLASIYTIIIYSSILIVLWGGVLLLDKLILKRAKKLRLIKNALKVVENYNAQVLEKKEKQIESENIEQIKVTKSEADNENKTKQSIELPNNTKSDNLTDKERKQKIKQKKYGNYNNKRKK